jgi:uncharacterized protein (DUF58 family)
MTDHLRFPLAGRIWFGVAVLLALVGWVKTINLLLLLGYMLLALLGVNMWLAWRTARRLTATRQPTQPIYAGEEATVTADVTNHSRRPVTALITDQAADNRSAWLFAPLPAGQTQPIAARWILPTRGRHAVGPLTVEAGYPFGLVVAARAVSPPGELVVLPAVGRVDVEAFRRWLVRAGAGETDSRRPSRRAAPGRGDVRGLRPYRAGDSPRDIHWKTSARRGQLLVREHDQGEPLDLVLIVDPWSADAKPTWQLEWALSLAMTLGRSWCASAAGSDLALIVAGSPPVVHSGRASPGFVRPAFACLADVTGSPEVSPVPIGLARRRSFRAVRVVVSTRPASPVAEELRRAGLPVAVVHPAAPPAWYFPPTPPAWHSPPTERNMRHAKQ